MVSPPGELCVVLFCELREHLLFGGIQIGLLVLRVAHGQQHRTVAVEEVVADPVGNRLALVGFIEAS
jgi:hypothetical protein